MTKPVTHTADVDVNSASKKGVTVPSRVDSGSIRRMLPVSMTSKKPNMMIWNGDLLLLCKSCHTSLHLLMRLYLFFISPLSIYGLKEVLIYLSAY